MCNSTANIYIPTIHVSWSRSKISEVFSREKYGKVIRIDFVRIVDKKLENDFRTFDERTNPNFRQAFIRLDVSDASSVNSPFLGLQPNMQIRVYPNQIVNRRRNPFGKGSNEYWMCLAATTPLSDSVRGIYEILAELNDLFPLLENSEDEEIFAHLNKHTRLLLNPPANYDDYCEMNQHQLDYNVNMMGKRIVEKDIPSKE